MSRDARRRSGNDSGSMHGDGLAASPPEGPAEKPDMQPADRAPGWNPSERVRLQITLDAETAFKLDAIARRARKPRGVIVARMISQLCKGYRSPTIPKVVCDLLRAS